MDGPYRLKVKLGSHEFEAEGDPQVVQSQFAEFKKMVAELSVEKSAEAPKPPQLPVNGGGIIVFPLEKILKVDDRIVSMTARTRSVPDALLMILLGQKNFRASELVTGRKHGPGPKLRKHRRSANGPV
jgi:hypothetical protein